MCFELNLPKMPSTRVQDVDAALAELSTDGGWAEAILHMNALIAEVEKRKTV